MITIINNGDYYNLKSNDFGQAILTKLPEESKDWDPCGIKHFNFSGDEDKFSPNYYFVSLRVCLNDAYIEIWIHPETDGYFRHLKQKHMNQELGPVVLTAIDPSEEDLSDRDFIRNFEFRYKFGSWSVTIDQLGGSKSDWVSPDGRPYFGDESGQLLLVNHFCGHGKNHVFWICGHTFEKLQAVMKQTQSVIMATPSPEERAAQHAEAEEFVKVQFEKMD